jgi:hypothetical protein
VGALPGFCDGSCCRVVCPVLTVLCIVVSCLMSCLVSCLNQCTSNYFEGMISLMDPGGSWVARWQRIDKCVPGMYAVEVIGELPQDIIDQCVENNLPYRSQKNKD